MLHVIHIHIFERPFKTEISTLVSNHVNDSKEEIVKYYFLFTMAFGIHVMNNIT